MEQPRSGDAIVSVMRVLPVQIVERCLTNRLSTLASLLIPYQASLFSTSSAAAKIKKRGRPECLCIIDLGHNATHVVPVQGDSIVWSAVKRHIISQRILTNLLKEALSFRQWDMMDEGWLVGHIKERCCFVAGSAGRRGDKIDTTTESASQWSYAGMVELCSALPRHKNPLALEYVLPDYSLSSTKGKLGYIKGQEDRTVAKDLDSFIVGANSVPMHGEGRRDNDREDEEGEEQDDSDNDYQEGEADLPSPVKQPKPSVDQKETEVDEDMEQVLLLERERFQIPEAMFDPGIIGMLLHASQTLLALRFAYCIIMSFQVYLTHHFIK
jgi:actin-related protein